MPARRDDRDDKQAVGGLARGQDVAHKALVSAAAAHLARHGGRVDQPRRQGFATGRGADRKLDIAYGGDREGGRSEEHTSELQSLMRISYAVFCLKRKTHNKDI